MRLTRVVILLWALSFPPAVAFSQGTGRGSPAPRSLPNPVLVFTGAEDYEAGGRQFTRYKFRVDNLADYPNELFAPSPELPPCGSNTKASRTWVDIYEQGGRRIYGFCALEGHDGLGRLWFGLERGAVPPNWVYVEMVDRKTNSKYKSNLAETTL